MGNDYSHDRLSFLYSYSVAAALSRSLLSCNNVLTSVHPTFCSLLCRHTSTWRNEHSRSLRTWTTRPVCSPVKSPLSLAPVKVSAPNAHASLPTGRKGSCLRRRLFQGRQCREVD